MGRRIVSLPMIRRFRPGGPVCPAPVHVHCSCGGVIQFAAGIFVPTLPIQSSIPAFRFDLSPGKGKETLRTIVVRAVVTNDIAGGWGPGRCSEHAVEQSMRPALRFGGRVRTDGLTLLGAFTLGISALASLSGSASFERGAGNTQSTVCTASGGFVSRPSFSTRDSGGPEFSMLPERTIRLSLTKGTRVIVASLDTSARRHELQLRWHPMDIPVDEVTIPPSSIDIENTRRTIRQVPLQLHCPREPGTSLSGFECRRARVSLDRG